MPELMKIDNTNKPQRLDVSGQVASAHLIGNVINLAESVVRAVENLAIERERTKQCKYNYKVIKEQCRTERLKIQNTYKLLKQRLKNEKAKLEKDSCLLHQLEDNVRGVQKKYIALLQENPTHSGIEEIGQVYFRLEETYRCYLSAFMQPNNEKYGL